MGLVKDALTVIESKDCQQRSIRPRKSLEMPVMVKCVQGFSKQEDNMLCCYYLLEDKWSKFNGTAPPNIGEIIPCHGKLYFHLFPDEDVGVRERRLLCYDPLSNCWSSLPYEDCRTVKKIFAMSGEAIFMPWWLKIYYVALTVHPCTSVKFLDPVVRPHIFLS